MILKIENLHKSFKEKDVLKGASAELNEGKIYGLLGRNGAGKTTFFNILYDELKKDKGSILFDDGDGFRDLKFEDVGMVFAETLLPEFLTGYEYIKFIIDMKNPHDITQIDRYFDLLSIDEIDRHKLIKDYSSGMKSKVALIEIYVQKPKIILLDEPLTAVDVVAGAEIKSFFRQLKDNHIIIVSTHMLDLAKDLCDKIILLNNGVTKPIDNLLKDENYEKNIIEALRNEDV